MCGIFGIYVKEMNSEVFNNLHRIYKNQKNRGVLGCGVARLRDNKITRLRGTEADNLFIHNDFISFWTNLKPNDLVIAHHRFSTNGGNGYIIESNHPFMNESKDLALIHNGVISNSDELYKELKDEGHDFESEIIGRTKKGQIANSDITDSEVILHLIEKRKLHKAIKGVKKLNGSYAIAFLRQRENRIYLYRKNNPIKVFTDRYGNIYFSSELDDKDKDFTLIKSIKEGHLYSISENGLKELFKVEEIVKTKTYNYYSYGRYGVKDKSNDLHKSLRDYWGY